MLPMYLFHMHARHCSHGSPDTRATLHLPLARPQDGRRSFEMCGGGRSERGLRMPLVREKHSGALGSEEREDATEPERNGSEPV